jgi:uncharacterized protein YggU (UPF0235/DUF167 family)
MLAVRVTPRAGRDGIEGERRDADGKAWLAVKLAAAPSDGAANEALIRLIAKSLSLRPRDVTLASGASSRLKRLRLEGEPGTIAARLSELTGNKA